MAPRGLSAEEKRVKLVEIFHESTFTKFDFVAPTKFSVLNCV